MKSSKQKRTRVAITAFAASVLAGALSSAAMAQSGPVSNFDEGYLDHHPEVANQLSANPSLVDNPQYMANHPGLQHFLANHPEMRADIKNHPYQFMNRENQLNSANGYNPAVGGNGYNGGPGPAGRFDQGYLDSHPQVAQQLSANPSLIDNPQYMAQHPGLQNYLANHPEVRADIKNHPYQFMNRENQLNSANGSNPPAGWNGYANGRPLATTGSYLSAHPDVAQQLNQNPRLIDNPQYIAQHPGLHEYLQNHPYARRDWRSHPYLYMRHEDRYQQTH